MADRATYLSKVLITRLTAMEVAGLDDAGPVDEAFEAEMRRDLVTKVLATELGVTDEASVSRVAAFLPPIIPGEPTSDREYTELAAMLRANLPLG